MDNNLNYYTGQAKNPYHLSIGAVVLNDKKEIACHHLSDINESKSLYILMRETVKPNELLEQAVARGLMEEFGMKAEIKDYLGSLESFFTNWEKAKIQKTTLYFLCDFRSLEEGAEKKLEKHFDWVEKDVIEWHDANFLIPKMKAQKEEFRRSDFDESEILERVKNYRS